MKHIYYSSLNLPNTLAIVSVFVGVIFSVYLYQSFLSAIIYAFFGFLLMRLFTITKCYKISYDKNKVNLINVFLPFIEYRYQLSDIKEIYEVGVMNWGSGINIITHSGKLRTFGTDGSSDQELTEMIDFINAKIKEEKSKSKSE